jgi:aminopeptidase N
MNDNFFVDFNDESKLKELEQFYEDHLLELGTGRLATETAIQKTKANMRWMKNNYNQIVEWLQSKNEEKRY